ncbi:hypothetical protein OSB04_005664 [Centaurea solstitialis]|uniref:Uncharacterized protein n=1 Tax=Centaurea solstitialis TaxID=347529 RepID=A0AA38TGI0_9ASTR|nr:hypothetical protein OSB04_005664 [Centaurea solstitialis]
MDVRLKMLEEQNKTMLALLAKLPGAAVPVEVEPKTGFQASPYVDEIALMEIPKKYNIPAFTTKYSGVTDPVEHVAQYKQLMWTASIPSQYQETCMCKSFGSTLTGAALQWLINLKPKSIESFAELVNQFTRQFASSRKMEKQTSDLYYVVQKTGETIRDYFNRFNAEMIEVKNCDIKTAIEAYKRGLDNSLELYTDLTKYPPENFDDVRARTLAHMRIEDDAIFRRKHSNEKKNLGAQKHDFKPKRVNKIGNSRHESKTRTSKGTGRIRYPDLSTYNFAGTSKELVDSLRKIDANVRWPKKPENPSKDKDQTKWCEFHGDHGHTTDECISLKKEIAYLKTNGHLKGIIGDEAKRPASPIHTKVVNCITGGSEVCGLTYSAAKRHAREGPEGYPVPEDSKTAAERELDAAKLTFDQDDLSGVNQKHHDALVIQLTIGNCLTKRVLVDGGSSANVIFSDTLKIMGIDRSNIVRRTTTLVGFNGDATRTLGEIVLPVFAKGINKQTKFDVIDCPSAYNAILGRPWIHDMKAVPSTYHQKIKFPSPWGEHSDCFAWSHEDMVGIDPDIISHKLNVDPTFKPVKQKRRKFASERNKVINDEVDNLLKTGKIREVKYPDWLANVVVVQKKNGKWRVCIDFTDLNKACPKDPFPLPHIDAMVDATAGHELLTFMDAYSGYNQILMHTDDQEKTAFMTDVWVKFYHRTIERLESLPPPPPVNNSRPIFPPLPSGPYPGATTFTYNQPQTGPRPFIPIPEPISHVPTAATPITHIPNLSNIPGTSNNPPIADIVDVRLKMLEEQNKAMLALLTKLPGAAVPIEVEPKTGFQASPYIDEIALVDIPKKYNIPAFTPKYSGISDPVEHIAQYKQLVWTVPIPTQFQEICMCKGFGSTLTGAALQWLINLKPKSIASWSELVNQFTRQFASSRKMEKQTSDLYYVVQKTGETIREYFNRFNAEMIEVKNCDVRTAIEAYKRGLDTSSELYTDLTKYPPENFDDVRARTLAHMRIEDDAIFRRKHSNDKKNLGAQKHDFKPKRVNKIDNSRRDQNKRSNQGKGKVRYPDLSTYHFAGTTKDVVDSLRNLEVNVRWPKKPENPSKDKDQTKWCDFHSDHGHNTDDCISLKKEIAYLKSNGHLKNLLGDDSKRPKSPVPTKVVNCITGGSEVCGLTYSAAKRHAREGPEGHPIPNESRTAEEKELDATKISFDIEDVSDAHQKHHDALVIQLTIGNCLTKRVLIDGGSSANVIFAETLKIMGIDRSNIVRRTTTLIGFNGDATSTLGEIILPVFAKGINKQTKFNVIDCPSAYNAILGRPWIHDMKAVPSTYHQKIKFPSPWGVQEIEHSDCFAWSHEDMVGIDPNIISHKLNVDPTFKPVKQKRRKFAPERNKVINEEVENLLKTRKIREVKYPDWLANVVVVQKKNGKWRVCIDFTDLNKACPKDPFPLPHIDAMVDATAGHELLTFMDAYSGYNQILMHKNDQEKTAFMTDKGIYCYKVMPFGLKNAGSTYQRLVNRMFKDHLGRTMEVYIDDMLVKSERSQDHIQHLKQSFDILREYKMKLNPTKCSFGVRAGKFLGYMVTRRGIEASPEQIKAILEIQSPRNVKEVQKLTGRVAALNRFISRSSDKCHLFYNVLRKNKGFDWTEAHEEALQSLKKYMSNPPLLMKPIEGESLQLYLAVSNNAVSAVLVREGDQHQQPIYYISKSFLDAETRYTSMEKHLLGLVTAAKKLRHYFESHHIIVVTNYPLKIVLRKPELTGRLAKWSIYLSSFDLTYQPRTAIKSQALADFVAEFSPGIEEPSYDEISNVMIHDNEPWTMHVDGASNARGSGLGVVLKSSHGGNIVYSIRCEFKTTNNEAEYEALIAGLDMAYNLGARWLHVRSDSLLVVNQINGEFQAKDSKMISYLKVAKDKIARFDKFSIEQIPRDLNMQADALANLGSAFNEPTLESIPIIHLMSSTIEEVQMIEENHDWSLDIWNYLKNDQLPEDKLEARKVRLKSSRYTIFNDQLYRRSTTGLILRCVVNKQQVDRILQEMHDGECGNHSGGRSLANRISRQGYYWPTLREDSIRYVQRCDACQRHSGTSHLPSEPLHSVLIPWPFMRWGMDIVEKLPPAPGQKVFLLVLTDYFSKWIEAAAFSQIRDKEVISFIQTNIIYRFGVPSEITCDNGSQFISERTRKFCDERGIKLITSTPRYPQSNGLAESSNKTIINSIRKRLKAAKGRWVEELPSVLWANRTTPRTSTEQTPFSLVYGCEAVLPIESQVHVARHRTIEQKSIDLCYDIDALEELREKAFQKMASQKAMVERYFNKKVKVKVFQLGDYVLRRVFPNTQESNAGKNFPSNGKDLTSLPRSWGKVPIRFQPSKDIARLPQTSHDLWQTSPDKATCSNRIELKRCINFKSQERKSKRQTHD